MEPNQPRWSFGRLLLVIALIGFVIGAAIPMLFFRP
jgi:hypothetical protein